MTFHGARDVTSVRARGAEQIAANYIHSEGGFKASNPNDLRSYLKTRFPDANPAVLTSVIRTTYAGFRAAAQQVGSRQQAPIPEAQIPVVPNLAAPYRYYGEATYRDSLTGGTRRMLLFVDSADRLNRTEIYEKLYGLASRGYAHEDSPGSVAVGETFQLLQFDLLRIERAL